ncbi:A/G-specific adenine glycosylase [bacterium]|nr:A/G-specific adenine glycosylase [bacterium]
MVQPILNWYRKNKRDLPWRSTRDPYKIWISEIMLQQTQVEQVIPYYSRFLNKFPSINTLARSDIDDVLKVWAGMGYYRRARYLHEAAIIMAERHDSKIPSNYELLAALPGFGPYTCGSVLSIAYNLPYPAIDGNVTRLISRLFKIESDITRTAAKRTIENIVDNLIPMNKASEFSQALMEMGATVCKSKKPKCQSCCCRKICRAYNEMSNPEILPIKTKKKRNVHFHIAAGIVRNGNTVLISKRPENVILGGLWEFPGGKKEKKESLGAACVRELESKTGISAKIVRPLMSIKHHYSHYSITIHFFCCSYSSGRVDTSISKWVKIDDLDKYAFSKVHQQIALKIRDGGC